MLYELGGTASRTVNDVKHLAPSCRFVINADFGVTLPSLSPSRSRSLFLSEYIFHIPSGPFYQNLLFVHCYMLIAN